MSAGAGEGAGSGGVVLAFVAGAVVGAVGALLLAPRSGAETRRLIAEATGPAGARARRARDAGRAAIGAAAKVFEEAIASTKGASGR